MTDTITLPRSVVEQALEALFMYKPMVTGVTFQHGLDAMQALRAALEQPQVEQDPVAEVIESHVCAGLNGQFTAVVAGGERLSVGAELFTHPQPPRHPLTEERIRDVAFDVDVAYGSVIDFARAIERAHGIGGGA